MHYLIVMTGDFWGVFFVLYVPGISLHSTVCSYLLWHLVFSFCSSVFFFLYLFLSFFEWEMCHAFKSKYGKILTVNSQIRAANFLSLLHVQISWFYYLSHSFIRTHPKAAFITHISQRYKCIC